MVRLLTEMRRTPCLIHLTNPHRLLLHSSSFCLPIGIVPYVDSANTGSIAGIVGGGGNVGAAILGLVFMSHDYEDAMEYMGYFTIGLSLLTPLIVIKGYRGIVFGKEDKNHTSRQQRSPLMVPKMQHSPHLVKMRRKIRAATQSH